MALCHVWRQTVSAGIQHSTEPQLSARGETNNYYWLYEKQVYVMPGTVSDIKNDCNVTSNYVKCQCSNAKRLVKL